MFNTMLTCETAKFNFSISYVINTRGPGRKFSKKTAKNFEKFAKMNFSKNLNNSKIIQIGFKKFVIIKIFDN